MIYVAHFTFYYLFRSLVFHYLYVEDLSMLLSVWLICCFSLLHDTHGVHLPRLTNPLSKGEVIKLALLPITCIVLQRNSSHHASLCNCENFSEILTWERGHSQVFGSAMMPFFFFNNDVSHSRGQKTSTIVLKSAKYTQTNYVLGR